MDFRAEHGVYIKDVHAAKVLQHEIGQAVASSPPHCRTHRIASIDDEAYLHDRSASQLSDPQPI